MRADNVGTEEHIVHVSKSAEKDREQFIDKSTGLEMDNAVDPQPLLEWFADKYKDFGANLEVSSSSPFPHSSPMLTSITHLSL